MATIDPACPAPDCLGTAYDTGATASPITPTELPIPLAESGDTTKTLSGMFEVLYDIVVAKAKIELDAGRIIDSQYATIVATSLIELIKQAINYQLASDKLEIDNQIKQEQWIIQQEILGYQRDMVAVDRNKKYAMIEKDYDIKVAQENQAIADTAFTTSKQQVMEWTRLDNIRIKAAAEFADFMKYLSAADVVPSSADFANLRKLVENVQIAVDPGQETINMDALYYPGGTNPLGGTFPTGDTQAK